MATRRGSGARWRHGHQCAPDRTAAAASAPPPPPPPRSHHHRARAAASRPRQRDARRRRRRHRRDLRHRRHARARAVGRRRRASWIGVPAYIVAGSRSRAPADGPMAIGTAASRDPGMLVGLVLVGDRHHDRGNRLLPTCFASITSARRVAPDRRRPRDPLPPPRRRRRRRADRPAVDDQARRARGTAATDPSEPLESEPPDARSSGRGAGIARAGRGADRAARARRQQATPRSPERVDPDRALARPRRRRRRSRRASRIERHARRPRPFLTPLTLQRLAHRRRNRQPPRQATGALDVNLTVGPRDRDVRRRRARWLIAGVRRPRAQPRSSSASCCSPPLRSPNTIDVPLRGRYRKSRRTGRCNSRS